MLDTPTDYKSEIPRPGRNTRTDLEMLVKLVQNKAHAIHEAVHVRWCTIVVGRALVCCEGFLEFFKVLHPFECKSVGLGISFVEDDDEWKLGLVEDTIGGRIKMCAENRGRPTLGRKWGINAT
jgi:hypothetical protein